MPRKYEVGKQVPTAYKPDLGPTGVTKAVVGARKLHTAGSVHSQAPSAPGGGIPQGPLTLRGAHCRVGRPRHAQLDLGTRQSCPGTGNHLQGWPVWEPAEASEGTGQPSAAFICRA